jgi:hypothetical protein
VEKIVDLPRMSGVLFALAMEVKNATDLIWLEANGWAMRDPIAISRDADCYRELVRDSRAEFTTAKDVNVRLRSGWFSDRGACYCAVARSVLRARRCQRSPTNRCDMGGGAPDRRRGLRGAACDPRLPLWGLSSAPRSGSRSRRCGARFRALIPKANQQLPQFGRSRPRYATFRTG